jgi:hypothetical protein
MQPEIITFDINWPRAQKRHVVAQGNAGGRKVIDKDPVNDNMKYMSKTMRTARSFTVDRSILDYLERTRSRRSRSERVNELLRHAILQEQYQALDREAAEFFACAGKAERAEARAFDRAARRTLRREGK